MGRMPVRHGRAGHFPRVSVMSNSNRGSLLFVLFATCVTATGGFLFGYDTAVINGANSYIKAHWSLSEVQEGLVGASAILGCIPGAMFAGVLSDRFGRKRMLFLCAILYGLSAVLFLPALTPTSISFSSRGSSAGWASGPPR